MTLAQHLHAAAVCLAQAGVASSTLEAELLLRHCLQLSRSALFLQAQRTLQPEEEAQFQELVARRCRREPLQYLVGSCEFWSLDFHVSPAALIPRPESEFLVTHALNTLAGADQIPHNILDLCTGSGVLAVVLAQEFPQAHIQALDLSWEALQLARHNIEYHGLTERIHLICADLLTCFAPSPLFDLIVTNPPYIKAVDIPTLEPEVRDWEPHLALSGGPTGMDCITQIFESGAAYLQEGGWIFMEIGADLEQEVLHSIHAVDCYDQIQVLADWAGLPRVAQARKVR